MKTSIAIAILGATIVNIGAAVPAGAVNPDAFPVGKTVSITICAADCRVFSDTWAPYAQPRTTVSMTYKPDIVRTLESTTPWRACVDQSMLLHSQKTDRTLCWVVKGKTAIGPVLTPATLIVTALTDAEAQQDKPYVITTVGTPCAERRCIAEKRLTSKRKGLTTQDKAAAVCGKLKLGTPVDWYDISADDGVLTLTVECLM